MPQASAELAKLLHRLELASVASCSCRTAALRPDIEDHGRSCRYRLLVSAARAIRSLMAELGAVSCVCQLSGDIHIVTSTTCCEVCDAFNGAATNSGLRQRIDEQNEVLAPRTFPFQKPSS